MLTKGLTEAKALLEDLINDLKKNFGELVMTRGKKHTLLGINYNITEDKNIDIEIKEQLLEAIEAFGENIDEKVTTPEYNHILLVNDQTQQLYEEKSKCFHSVVEKYDTL